MSEEFLLQLLGVLAGGIGLVTFVIRRNQRLVDELITTKTQILQEQVTELTEKLKKTTEDLENLIKRADQLRTDLDTEKTFREKETSRATRAEYLEAAARKELERKQIEVDTLKSVFRILNVTVPEGTVQVTIVRTPEQQVSTRELTESALKVVKELNGHAEQSNQ